jgi:hypothetical protein
LIARPPLALRRLPGCTIACAGAEKTVWETAMTLAPLKLKVQQWKVEWFFVCVLFFEKKIKKRSLWTIRGLNELWWIEQESFKSNQSAQVLVLFFLTNILIFYMFVVLCR